MKKFTIQAVFLILVIVGALYIYKNGADKIPFVPPKINFNQITVGQAKINVEVADTADKRTTGLSGRESLASDSGMLFVFDKADKYPFWMKGMKIPLDFIWIRDNKVTEVTENVPPPQPGQKDSDLTIYESKETVDRVLEVSAGFVKLNNIKVGDEIKIPQ